MTHPCSPSEVKKSHISVALSHPIATESPSQAPKFPQSYKHIHEFWWISMWITSGITSYSTWITLPWNGKQPGLSSPKPQRYPHIHTGGPLVLFDFELQILYTL